MGSNVEGLFSAATPDIPNIDLGMYDATLASVETTFIEGGQYGQGFTTKDENGQDVNRFRWVFAPLDDEGEALYDEGDPILLDCITGLQFFAKAKNPSKQVRIMKALLTPEEFEAWADGEPAPPMKALLGRKVQIEVDENGKGYPTVVNVLAPRSARRAGGRRSSASADA